MGISEQVETTLAQAAATGDLADIELVTGYALVVEGITGTGEERWLRATPAGARFASTIGMLRLAMLDIEARAIRQLEDP